MASSARPGPLCIADTDTPSKRHDEGVYYTSAHLTRYILDCTLGRTLTERREAIFARLQPEEEKAWTSYREALKGLRVIDPACGAGVFLVAAHDALRREYARVNDALAALRGGQVESIDLDRTVLDHNLFGIDLSAEAVELTRRSLWSKPAQHGRRPPYLDRNISCGDSIVQDPDLSPTAFDWTRWHEGFDVVIGNPPYIRHELFPHLKDHLGRIYAAYHGRADIYVYFFERGLSVLKPGGRLGFIVTNKWLRAGYAGPLRQLLKRCAEIESVIDFGHAPLFEDADTFPCIITLRKLADGEILPDHHQLSVTSFPRAELSQVGIAAYVASHQYAVPQQRLDEEAWSLEPPAVEALYRKIKDRGRPLSEVTGLRPQVGIKTGYNEAFLIDTPTRDALIAAEPSTSSLIKKYLRGQDVKRWSPVWGGLWIILLQSSSDRAWPWAAMAAPEAEACFAATYPALYARLKPREAALRRRTDQGRFWWELRSCAYYDAFTAPKIIYQEIQFHPSYALDQDGFVLNNKGFFLRHDDPWLLAVLNSPLLWWHNFRYLGRMKDEALSPTGVKMEQLPIAPPDDEGRAIAEEYVPQLVSLVKQDKACRQQALAMERRLAALVNRAYGLTPDEVDLLWSTAPPRMPVGR